MDTAAAEAWWAGLADQHKDQWVHAWSDNAELNRLIPTLPQPQQQQAATNGEDSWLFVIHGTGAIGAQGPSYQMREPFNTFMRAKVRERLGYDPED